MPHPEYDWNFTTTVQEGLSGREIAYPRGYILGGSSSVSSYRNSFFIFLLILHGLMLKFLFDVNCVSPDPLLRYLLELRNRSPEQMACSTRGGPKTISIASQTSRETLDGLGITFRHIFVV